MPDQRAADRIQADVQNLARDLNALAVAALGFPMVQGGAGGGCHVVGEGRQVALGEHRLHELALALPQLAAACHEALAKDRVENLILVGLAVVVLIGDQDMAHRLGSADDDKLLNRGVEQRDVAIAFAHRREHFQRPSWRRNCKQPPQHVEALRPRRTRRLDGRASFGSVTGGEGLRRAEVSAISSPSSWSRGKVDA